MPKGQSAFLSFAPSRLPLCKITAVLYRSFSSYAHVMSLHNAVVTYGNTKKPLDWSSVYLPPVKRLSQF